MKKNDVRVVDDQGLTCDGNVAVDPGGVLSGSNGGSDSSSKVVAANQSHHGNSKSGAEEENGKVGNEKESSNIEGSGNRNRDKCRIHFKLPIAQGGDGDDDITNNTHPGGVGDGVILSNDVEDSNNCEINADEESIDKLEHSPAVSIACARYWGEPSYFDTFPSSSDIATVVNLVKASVAKDNAGNYQVIDQEKMETLMGSLGKLENYSLVATLPQIELPENTSIDKMV